MLATVSGALVRQTCAKKRFRCLSVASCSPSGGWSAVELRKASRAAKFSLELIRAKMVPIGLLRNPASWACPTSDVSAIDIWGCGHAGWPSGVDALVGLWVSNDFCRDSPPCPAAGQAFRLRFRAADEVAGASEGHLRRAGWDRPFGHPRGGYARRADRGEDARLADRAGARRRVRHPLPHRLGQGAGRACARLARGRALLERHRLRPAPARAD